MLSFSLQVKVREKGGGGGLAVRGSKSSECCVVIIISDNEIFTTARRKSKKRFAYFSTSHTWRHASGCFYRIHLLKTQMFLECSS